MKLQKNIFAFFTAILVFAPSFCVGQLKTEHEAAKQLISMVENGVLGQSAQAQKLFMSIPTDSKCKPVAALALTMIHVREREFSDAWKVLTAASQDKTAATKADKIAMERLKLWLLLEADAAEKAGPQLMKIMKAMIDSKPDDTELIANCSFIGSVAGMLNSDNASPTIPQSMTNTVLEQLLDKVESTNAKMKLQEHLDANRHWGIELLAVVGKFESLGQVEGEQLLSSTETELDSTRRELTQLRAELKSAGGEKRAQEDIRRKWFKNRKGILQEMNRETPGRPQYPVEPGPAPTHPIQPRGHYKVDPKTLAAKYVPPTACEESRYQDRLKDYEKRAQSWRTRSANYQRDIAEYPAKIKLWEQQDAARRAYLNDQKQKADMGIASAESTMKRMQDEIKQGTLKNLRDVVDRQNNLERLVTMSTVALRNIKEKNINPKQLIRPSSFSDTGLRRRVQSTKKVPARSTWVKLNRQTCFLRLN